MFYITEKELADLQKNNLKYKNQIMARIFIDEYFAFWERVKVPVNWSLADLDNDLKRCAQYFLNRSYKDLIVIFFPDNSILNIEFNKDMTNFYDYRYLDGKNIQTGSFYFDGMFDADNLLRLGLHSHRETSYS